MVSERVVLDWVRTTTAGVKNELTQFFRIFIYSQDITYTRLNETYTLSGLSHSIFELSPEDDMCLLCRCGLWIYC